MILTKHNFNFVVHFGVKLGGNENEYITNQRVKGMKMNHGKRME